MISRIIIICTLLFRLTTATVFAQHYLNNNRSEIIKKIYGLVDSTYTVSISQTIAHVDTFFTSAYNGEAPQFDTVANIKICINGFEKIELEYFFVLPDNNCDSIVIKYYCGKCANKHINDFLAEKDMKWKKLGTDNYISGKQTNKFVKKDPVSSRTVSTVGSPKMTIRRTPDDPVCATVCFSIPMMDKIRWKQLTKK